jgi:hypothetical protein
MTQTQEMVIRVEGFADSYGLGTEVAPGCTLFKAGDYNLTRVELNRKLIAAAPKGGPYTIKGRGL